MSLHNILFALLKFLFICCDYVREIGCRHMHTAFTGPVHSWVVSAVVSPCVTLQLLCYVVIILKR
jgi:hypothetical protein